MLRPSLAILIAVLLGGAACSGGGSGGAGGGSGGRQGGSGGSSGAGFCDDFARAYCDFAVKCRLASSSTTADCVPYISRSFCSSISGSLSRGYRSVDPAAAQSCTAFFQTAACDARLSDLFDRCGGVVTAHSGTQGGCFSSSDCLNPNEGCGGAVCKRTCQAAGLMGQPCPSKGGCAAGLHCDPGTLSCAAPGPVGTACDFDDAWCDGTTFCDTATQKCAALPTTNQACRFSTRKCAQGDYCEASGSLCKPQLSLGAACDARDACQASLYCDLGGNPPSCKPRLASNAACPQGSSSCSEGLVCVAGLCGAPISAGAACKAYEDCVTTAPCDPVMKVCTAYTGGLDAGESCTSYNRSCATGLKCRGFAFNPDGGVGTAGACGVPVAGDACHYLGSSECPSRTHCAVDGGTGTCSASVTGSACQASAECKSGDLCVNKLCATAKAMGSTCTSSSECALTLSCIKSPTTGARTCAPLKGFGEACAAGEVSCLFPFACIGGTCKHVGAASEACLGNNVCVAGACDSATSTCVALVADGATCKLQFECASGRCVAGKCGATCP